MISHLAYIGELADAQQPQYVDDSFIKYVDTGIIPVNMFNEIILWGDFANSREIEKELDYLEDMVLADAEELRWEEAFARSADTLTQLAEEALAEHRKGLTQVLDPDKL